MYRTSEATSSSSDTSENEPEKTSPIPQSSARQIVLEAEYGQLAEGGRSELDSWLGTIRNESFQDSQQRSSQSVSAMIRRTNGAHGVIELTEVLSPNSISRPRCAPSPYFCFPSLLKNFNGSSVVQPLHGSRIIWA